MDKETPHGVADPLENMEISLGDLVRRLRAERIVRPSASKITIQNFLRHWRRQGFLPKPRVVSRGRHGRRVYYPASIVRQIRLIKGLQAWGFRRRRLKDQLSGTAWREVMASEREDALRQIRQTVRELEYLVVEVAAHAPGPGPEQFWNSLTGLSGRFRDGVGLLKKMPAGWSRQPSEEGGGENVQP